MSESMQDAQKRLSESGLHEIQQLADPSQQVRYRHLQWVAIASALLHSSAVFLAIYAFREGDFNQFSLVKLMQFIPSHMLLWQLNCFVICLSCVSFLILFLYLKQIVRVRNSVWLTAASFFVAIAVTMDLQTYSNLMIYFADLSNQLIRISGFKQYLMLEGWRSLNHALTLSMIVANTLYALAGLILAAAIVTGYGLPRWLGWTSVPIWLVALAASVLTFNAQFGWTMVVMFAMVIAFILWTIALAVAVDPYTQSHRIALDQPAN